MTQRAALLAVVSTDPQAGEDRYSLPMQLETTRAAAARIEAAVVAEFSFAHSRSYDALADLCRDSPDYARLVDLIQQGRLDLLVVYRYDRIGRTLLLQLEMLRLCKRHGVAVWSVTEAPNGVETGADEWMLQVMRGMLAEQEVRAIVMRAKAGKLGRARAGLHMSWTHPPYGYRPDGDHSRPLLPDPITAPIVRQIFGWRAEGWGCYRIAATLTERRVPTPTGRARWCRTTVLNILRNSYYVGEIAHHGAAYPGQHAPLVSPQLWASVQRVNAAHARDARSSPWAERYLLSGLVLCGLCGHSAAYQRAGGCIYLRCAHANPGVATPCPGVHRAARAVHAYVDAQVRAALEDPAAHLAMLAARHQQPDTAQRIAEAQAALADLDAQESRIAEAIVTGRFPMERLIEQQDRLTAQRAAVTADLARLQADAQRLHRAHAAVTALADLAARYADLLPAERRALYRQLIYRVTLPPEGDPVIQWLV